MVGFPGELVPYAIQRTPADQRELVGQTAPQAYPGKEMEKENEREGKKQQSSGATKLSVWALSLAPRPSCPAGADH